MAIVRIEEQNVVDIKSNENHQHYGLLQPLRN